MAELLYVTGPMDCGKSAFALQFDHTRTAAGRRGRLFTHQDRSGEAAISSRLGLRRPAIEVAASFDFWVYLTGELTAGERVDYLVCDEAQFYRPGQIDQLARVVDDLDIDVLAVGIATDFQTRLFPGSQRLIELSDRVEVLQVRALCWCGSAATHNARIRNGVMVHAGDQVVVGGTERDAEELTGGSGQPAETDNEPAAYEVLCRRHHRMGLTRALASAESPDPLPFGRPFEQEKGDFGGEGPPV